MRPVLTDEWGRLYAMVRNLEGLGAELPPNEKWERIALPAPAR